MAVVKALSPAKINLMLRVTGQRADGYHELQTCFKLLNWGDDMHFDFIDALTHSEVDVKGFDDIPIQDNLIYQASQLLQPHIKKHQSVSIDVTKKIPQGGGLGGGSSNAATTLKVLNKAWDCQLTQRKLMQLGLQLGADVPVFVLAQDALGTGVGEALMPVALPQHHVLLLFPECSIPTVDVFKNKGLKRDQKPIPSQEVAEARHWINDCLPVVLANYPSVNHVYQALSQYFHVYLSGTGSTLFILFDDLDAARKAKKMAQTVCSCHLVPALG